MQDEDSIVGVLNEWTEMLMRRSMSDFLRQAKQNGLSLSQMGALARLRNRRNCGVSEFGEEMGITSAAASQMIDRMVQQGLISRSEDPHDRRNKQIVPTDKGKELLVASIRARQRWLEDLNSELSEAEREQVRAALRILIDKAALLDQPLERVSE